jgi:hypothetical protein
MRVEVIVPVATRNIEDTTTLQSAEFRGGASSK